MRLKIYFFIINLLFFSISLYADHPVSRPDSHAPIGVMGDHFHKEGEWMFSYRYMFMHMDGNRSGTSDLSTADVLADFPVSPTKMDMEMHMIGLMYAPSDWLTLMAMLPLLEISMDHRTRMGTTFSTRSSGIGDMRLAGLIRLHESEHHRVHFNAGISVPTGDLDVYDATPMGPRTELPYPMRTGSGTADLLPGITYVGFNGVFSWGAQGTGTIRLGRNSEDYSLGDGFESSLWGSVKANDWASFSLRTRWQTFGNIDGRDGDLNPAIVPTADPDRRAGDQLDLGLGVNFYVPGGPLSGLRFAAELLVPVYQDLDGPQLETDFTWIFGTQYTF